MLCPCTRRTVLVTMAAVGVALGTRAKAAPSSIASSSPRHSA